MNMKQKVQELLKQMTLKEKASFIFGGDFWHTQGIERLGIPAVMMCDGPHGLRKQSDAADNLGINDSIETVCFPTASALACSFDTEVMEKLGEALGQECQSEDVGMLLGPGLNMKRSPLCGRNFEYFSEDPYLAGKLAAAYIRSLQSKGVSSCVKHFAANNQESYRMSGSSNVDERTFREIYLPAFELAVTEGKTRSVMCAYNAVNGTFCSENKTLLTDILRKEWRYSGFVVTDWGASKDAAKGVEAGVDLVMPGGSEDPERTVLAAIEAGDLKAEELDQAVANVLTFVLEASENRDQNAVIDREKSRQLSGSISAKCAVLLKNERILPLSKKSRVAFIGEFAKHPRYQGGGSSHVNVPHAVSAMEAAGNLTVEYAKGYKADSTEPDPALIREAVQAAGNADSAVIFAGLPNSFETEGVDRRTMDIPENQNRLIEAVAEAQPNTVVVLHGGSPMSLPWIDKVKAVLCMYLGGELVGESTVKLLYGDENPCGKLAETWPLKVSDNPSWLNFPGVEGNVNYQEGIFIGYRYYDKKEMSVLYPFGYGLSYTRFEYSNLHLDRNRMTDQEILAVTCTVKNTGNMVGQEAVQLYVADKESTVMRPIRELKGFQKVKLLPGEEKQVSFTLNKRSFAYYEPKIDDWFVESGMFEIEIGASSRDIRLRAEIEVDGTAEIPVFYTAFSPMISLSKTEKGRKLMKQLTQMTSQPGGGVSSNTDTEKLGEGAEQMMDAMVSEMPLGALVTFGLMKQEQLDAILAGLNA